MQKQLHKKSLKIAKGVDLNSR